jgi:hypothetical protein
MKIISHNHDFVQTLGEALLAITHKRDRTTVVAKADPAKFG